jgi:hypothetical protein
VDFGWEWFWRADTSKTKTEMDGNIKNVLQKQEAGENCTT